jgi:hypothetical protein
MWDKGCRLGRDLCLFDKCTDMMVATKVLHIALNIRAFRAVKSICLSMNGSNGGNLCGMLMESLVMVCILHLGGEAKVTDITSDDRLVTRNSKLALQMGPKLNTYLDIVIEVWYSNRIEWSLE